MRLKGKTALVAGAGRNNGRAIALAFAREGADLILIARKREEELRQTAAECESSGAQVLRLLADVSDPGQVEHAVRQGLERFGKIDVLTSVAGVRPQKPFWEIGSDEWLQVFAVNLNAAFYLAKAVAPGMMARKSGSIIALGGTASLTSAPDRAHVVASKHGLYGLIKSLALELGPYGVRANLLALAQIENKRLNPEWYAETGGDPYTAERLATVPLGRNGRPEEVGNVAVFLASDDSSYVTGDRLLCAGGKYM